MAYKQLFRKTATLLRTALLLGTMIFVNTQSKAQTLQPDAFETMDPASIIGDGNYYYIQFYTPQHDKCSYLTDRGENKLAATKDFLPHANNRLWTLERVNDNSFKLKSKAGYYIGFDRVEDATGNRYVSVVNNYAATTFTFQQSGDGYNILDLDHNADNNENGLLGRYNNLEWLTGLSIIRNNDTGKNISRMRFAKLKSNAAFIIYYKEGDVNNSDPNAATIRHYLTYSRTSNAVNSEVSSRKSIIPSDKSLHTLPTAAAYHQDGLWDVVSTSGGEEFYIKKHGENRYLTTSDDHKYGNDNISTYYTVLGDNNDFSRYILESPDANRYTRIRNNAPTWVWGYARYLTHFNGDGWPALERHSEKANDPDFWYAGFLPVEVVQEDQFYQVLLKVNDQMVGVSSDGKAVLKPYSDFNPDLWTLEQFGDYQHYRLKSRDGKYYIQLDQPLSDTAPTEGLGVFSNTDLNNTIFTSIQWVPKTETRIPHDITHKVSNVKLYYQYNPTTPERQEVYQQQGLVTDDISDWQNADGTQKVNEFKITHYVKKNEPIEFGLPTTLGANNDHRFYQRWYHYNDETCDNTNYPDGSDIEGLKNHLNLKTSAGEVMGYLYNNGLVTGEELDWPILIPGAKKYESHLFTYNNSEGNNFTLAADVSRYNDFEYQNSASHLDGNLQEPSLTMRYIFYMKDAKEMARQLMTCTGDKWLEEKVIHFPAKRLKYETSKSEAYQGEFIGIRHNFKDYWVFNGQGEGDDNLVKAVIDNTSGYLRFVVEPGATGITPGGKNNKGYYLYDEGKPAGSSYGDSRFVAFKYPGEQVTATGESNPAYLKVYFDFGGNSYQIAKFTLIFDQDTSTLPWTSVDGSEKVKGTYRDPNELSKKADLIAKITFDYPEGATYKTSSEKTAHNNGVIYGWWYEIPNSSPLPLTFDNTNYGFDGDNASWGSYSIVSTMPTRWGNKKTTMPVNAATYGYDIAADEGMQSAFLYIDASEQPGDICKIDFAGEFCAGDQLMCTGWISGSNKVINDNRCPGSVTITVKGLRKEGGVDVIDDIYRFCPGQCYELDNGSGVDGNEGGTHVVWQQFYFEFNIHRKYERQWVEVNNNCVSSTGGDFMLDNIEVYAMVPQVDPELNTPICVNKDASEMQLLKLNIEFDPLIVASGVNTAASEGDHNFGLVFLNKEVFLNTLKEGLQTYNGINISLAELEANVNAGVYKDIVGTYKSAYEAAFDAALLGKHEAIWDSNNPNDNSGQGILNFHWNHNFEMNEAYSFTKAVNRQAPVFGYTDSEGRRYIILNGNYPQLPWEENTDYYIVYYNDGITDIAKRFIDFNICSDCNKATEYRLNPPFKIISLDASDETNEVEVCEGQIPTVLTDLVGYNTSGELVQLADLNFDWWLGDPTIDSETNEPILLATLENFHAQVSSKGVRLDVALSTLRAYYPGITTLDGIVKHLNKTPNLTEDMIEYLQELVDKGQLILHQKSINIPAQKVSNDNPYCYFVACPIHDGDFETALNNGGRNDVVYFCDEPQGLSLKIGEKAPTLKCGFVSGENGFDSYAYPTDSDPVLSIRLANKAQFKTVQHGEKSEEPMPWENNTDLKYLWLPIRNASTTVERAADYNVYLASTDDPDGDKAIYREVKATGALPIVGKIERLYARNSDPNGYNRLCVYFTNNFDVREGYTYTLSLPFKEAGDVNTCDGTLLLNLKIVPDYEVWTGAAGNTDWNNDQNWRRADGNLRASLDEPTSSSPLNNNELYRTNDLPSTSPLAEYTTNSSNYRTAKDRLLRKGFAPLYCTHVLIKNNEWGDAPVLYDALDGNEELVSYPFPNLRDKDGWDGTSEAAVPTKATSTPILRFDMQARSFDKWAEVYGGNPDKGRSGDLIAEMYQVNSCDEIAFQAGAELLNAYLLNYNNAWMEYQLDNKRWYLMGSALQGTISGEWYAPKKTAQQKTTYYEPVTFDAADYDRYNPAIYQRSWDKAKAVLYEVGADYSTSDNPDDLVDDGSASQGAWGNDNSWNTAGADAYLGRLGYKPMGGKKANVAIKGLWSNTYNDATVDYAKGGFSVMVMNHLKGENNDQSDNVTVVRLPKEDLIYKYWTFDQGGSGTDTNLSSVQSALNRAKNRGRLKTDLLLPAYSQKAETGTKYNPVSGDDALYGYGDRTITRIPTQKGDNALPLTLRPIEETVSAGASNLGFYLVENPFPCGLNMKEFFAVNTGLEKKYWLLTTGTGQNPRQQLVQQAPDGEWITSDGTTYDFATEEAVVAPGQGFFVQATTAGEATNIKFTAAMQAQTRFGKKDKENGTPYTIVVGTRQKTQPKVDDQGNPVYVQELNEDGTPKTDDQGNPIYVYELDIDGNPVLDDQGQPKLLQAVEPVFNDDGTPVIEDITDQVIIYSYKQDTDMPEYKLKTRGGESSLFTLHSSLPSGLVITAKRDNSESSALVMQRSNASNDFLPEEDTEVFINSDLGNAPTVYTLCGRLATTINTIHDFRCLPVGVESTSDAPCTLTFEGVEMLGDSVAFYDAVEKKLTKLESGMTVSVSGQTQNRYYLVRSLIQEEAAAETHLQIFTEGLKAKVIASTAEPITAVRCFDLAGQLLYSASPQSAEHSFTLPHAGVYIIEAQTENDRKTLKVIAK